MLQSQRNVFLWHFGDIQAAWSNVRFQALFGHQRIARLGRRLTDCVDKRFGGRERAILIHNEGQARNIDSKNATLGFDSCSCAARCRLYQQNLPEADFRHTYNHSARITAGDLVEAACKAARDELQSDDKVQVLGFRVFATCVEP